MAALRICFLMLFCAAIIRGKDPYEFCGKLSELKVCECGRSNPRRVVCSNVSDVQTLVNSLEKLRHCTSARPNVFSLENTTSLEALPVGLFDGLGFEFLALANVDLNFLVPKSRSSPAFNGLAKTLRKVELDHVRYVENWDWSKIEPMAKVYVLKIVDSEFNYILTSFSQAFFHVVELVIKNSNVIMIQDKAIPSKYLVTLDLSNNQLSTLPLTVFSTTPAKLETLHLSGNLIKSLDEDLLRNTPALRVLALDNNQLFQVSERLFTPWQPYGGRKRLHLYIKGTRTNEEDCKAVSALEVKYDIAVYSQCNTK